MQFNPEFYISFWETLGSAETSRFSPSRKFEYTSVFAFSWCHHHSRKQTCWTSENHFKAFDFQSSFLWNLKAKYWNNLKSYWYLYSISNIIKYFSYMELSLIEELDIFLETSSTGKFWLSKDFSPNIVRFQQNCCEGEFFRENHIFTRNHWSRRLKETWTLESTHLMQGSLVILIRRAESFYNNSL